MRIVGDDVRRFSLKVDRSGDCWVWTGAKAPSGYGHFYFEGRIQPAHRVAWKLGGRSIPQGMILCHHCDNPPCVRLEHLFVGSSKDNYDDMAAKGRRGVAAGDRNGSRLHLERRPRGEQQSQAKLTVDSVRAIRAAYAAGGETYASLATRFGVSPALIRNVIKRRNWGHVA